MNFASFERKAITARYLQGVVDNAWQEDKTVFWRSKWPHSYNPFLKRDKLIMTNELIGEGGTR